MILQPEALTDGTVSRAQVGERLPVLGDERYTAQRAPPSQRTGFQSVR
ncbi:MAG TPA: hypothetical protein VLQ80_07180 [Candidatus Saccharimonadia bacterium]|nr:hypothetical protein [Candidatus Saccharimonadia bacterium]